MKIPKPPRSRNATLDDIRRNLQDAGDYLGAMIKHEAEAAACATGPTQDLEGNSEAHRRFVRDFRAFLGAATTAWNYMIQAAIAANTRVWLDGRLSSNLCKFHRELENQAAHDYGVLPGVQQKVHYEAEGGTPIIQSAVGPVPARMVITGFGGMAYHHNPRNVEPDVAPLCESVQKKYPNETIVEIAARYLDELSRAFRTGERGGKFGDPASPAVDLRPMLLHSSVDGQPL